MKKLQQLCLLCAGLLLAVYSYAGDYSVPGISGKFARFSGLMKMFQGTNTKPSKNLCDVDAPGWYMTDNGSGPTLPFSWGTSNSYQVSAGDTYLWADFPSGVTVDWEVASGSVNNFFDFNWHCLVNISSGNSVWMNCIMHTSCGDVVKTVVLYCP